MEQSAENATQHLQLHPLLRAMATGCHGSNPKLYAGEKNEVLERLNRGVALQAISVRLEMAQ
jgi:Flp pilus assembly CpaF family ATPase